MWGLSGRQIVLGILMLVLAACGAQVAASQEGTFRATRGSKSRDVMIPIDSDQDGLLSGTLGSILRRSLQEEHGGPQEEEATNFLDDLEPLWQETPEPQDSAQGVKAGREEAHSGLSTGKQQVGEKSGNDVHQQSSASRIGTASYARHTHTPKHKPRVRVVKVKVMKPQKWAMRTVTGFRTVKRKAHHKKRQEQTQVSREADSSGAEQDRRDVEPGQDQESEGDGADADASKVAVVGQEGELNIALQIEALWGESSGHAP